MHGQSPTSNFGGTVPPVPPRSPPLVSLTVTKPHKHWTFLLLPAAFSWIPDQYIKYAQLYEKSLPVKISIIFSSIQLNLSLHYNSNPASTYTYYRLFILFHQSKVTET